MGDHIFNISKILVRLINPPKSQRLNEALNEGKLERISKSQRDELANLVENESKELVSKLRNFNTLILILLLLISSCVTSKKTSKYLDKHPNFAMSESVRVFNNPDSLFSFKPRFGYNDSLASTYCHLVYPCKDGEKITTKYIKGEPVLIKGDTKYIEVNCDSAVKANSKTVKISVPYYIEVDTQSILDEIRQTDKAQYNSLLASTSSQKSSLENKINSYQIEIAKQKKKLDREIYFIIALIISIAFNLILLKSKFI